MAAGEMDTVILGAGVQSAQKELIGSYSEAEPETITGYLARLAMNVIE